MPEGQDIIREIQTHFSQYKRPENYINRFHCQECEEHYQELLEVSADQISYTHVENPGWDPTCFLSPDAFRYYFPGLVRIAEQHRQDWLPTLVGRLGVHFVDSFSREDRALVKRVLEYWWLCEDITEWDRTDMGRVLETWHSRDDTPER
jgi:hypothetical protein